MALTERNVAFLDEIGITKVMVSADGDTPESHNKIRGNPKAMQLMEAGLERLKEKDIPSRVNIMVHKANKDSLLEIVDNLYRKGYTLNYDWVAPFGSETSSKLGISAAEYFEAVAPLRNPNDIVTMPTACGRDLNWDSDDYEPGCGVGYSYLFITSTGEMAICPNLTSRENSVLFNGPSLKEISIFEAWSGDPYFDKHRFVSCENVQTCAAGTSCRGGCRANAYAQSEGKLDSPNMIECNVRKNHTDKYVDFQARYNAGEYGIVIKHEM
jgi:radical SAM protein with 4Fe4S-binding SPASM domain